MEFSIFTQSKILCRNSLPFNNLVIVPLYLDNLVQVLLNKPKTTPMTTNFLNQLLPSVSSRALVIVVLNLISFFILSQNQVEPGVEWKSVTWPANGITGAPQTQQQSGQDWWYGHRNIYNSSGIHTGYATVGYTSLISTHTTGISTHTAWEGKFNEGSSSPYNPVSSVPNYTNDCEPSIQETQIRGVFGQIGLDGKMIYCKSVVKGELLNLVQDPTNGNSDFFYVVGAAAGARPYNNNSVYLPYNPTSAHEYTTNYFTTTTTSLASTYTGSIGHMYVAKVSISTGTIVWQAIYGYEDYYSADPQICYTTPSPGYDIIYASNGNLIAVGGAGTGTGAQPFVIEINPINGYVLNRAIHSTSGTNSYGLNAYGGTAYAITEIGTSGNYVIGGVINFP